MEIKILFTSWYLEEFINLFPKTIPLPKRLNGAGGFGIEFTIVENK